VVDVSANQTACEQTDRFDEILHDVMQNDGASNKQDSEWPV
jgi:hypothetical protein